MGVSILLSMYVFTLKYTMLFLSIIVIVITSIANGIMCSHMEVSLSLIFLQSVPYEHTHDVLIDA